jgi:hypothetical protein
MDHNVPEDEHTDDRFLEFDHANILSQCNQNDSTNIHIVNPIFFKPIDAYC